MSFSSFHIISHHLVLLEQVLLLCLQIVDDVRAFLYRFVEGLEGGLTVFDFFL
jgi:hypothetical protein